MSKSENYTNFLLEWSKSGSKTSFIELCEHLYQDVYCAVYQLLNDNDLAFRITKDTFATAWNNISKYDEKKESKIWILEIAVILCFYYINTEESSNKKKKYKSISFGLIESSNYKPLEEEYASLTFHQKLTIILASKLNFSLYDMRNVFEDLNEL